MGIIVDTFEHVILEVGADRSELARVCRFNENYSEEFFFHEVKRLFVGEGDTKRPGTLTISS